MIATSSIKLYPIIIVNRVWGLASSEGFERGEVGGFSVVQYWLSELSGIICSAFFQLPGNIFYQLPHMPCSMAHCGSFPKKK